jgi:hypothetical protein
VTVPDQIHDQAGFAATTDHAGLGDGMTHIPFLKQRDKITPISVFHYIITQGGMTS